MQMDVGSVREAGRDRMTFKIVVGSHLVRVLGSPQPTIDSLISVVTEFLDPPDHSPGMSSIWDFRGSDLSLLTAEDLGRLQGIHSASTIGMPQRKTAIVVDRELSFGIARMYEMMLTDPQVSTRVFRSMPEAEEWVSGEGSEDDPS
jgi:hypothetical protein